VATVTGALITGTIALTVGILAYIFGKRQKEHEIRFSGLYERRAKIIAQLHKLLNELSTKFEDWPENDEDSEGQNLHEQADSLKQTLDKFRSCFYGQAIWFRESNSEEADRFYQQTEAFYRRAQTHWFALYSANTIKEENDANQRFKNWVEISYPTIREALESEFGRALGMKKKAGGTAVLSGWRRMGAGVVGTTLIGGGLGFLLQHFVSGLSTCSGIFVGVCIGLGMGLLLEHISPSRTPVPLEEEQDPFGEV
jgi:hypothetical protein